MMLSQDSMKGTSQYSPNSDSVVFLCIASDMATIAKVQNVPYIALCSLFVYRLVNNAMPINNSATKETRDRLVQENGSRDNA